MNALLVPCSLLALLFVACGGVGSGLQGTVTVDGSSTVFPISEAVAEEFRSAEPVVRVTIGISGTGGGFKRFCAGDTDISNASRPIKDSEREACARRGIEFLELEVALDGLSVVVHPKNDFIDFLTVAELKRIWEPGSKIRRWNQVRPHWPDERIQLFGPGTDSGTFDYFTEVIAGASGASRSDFTASEDDNVLVRGIAGERYSLGYFGYAYFTENRDKIKAVPIDPGDGVPVPPTKQTVHDGSYRPLSRPLFMYVNVSSLRESLAVREFVGFYLAEGAVLVSEVGYVSLPPNRYEEQFARVASALE